MALTDWIDTLCDKWAFDAGNGKTVLSFRLVNQPILPASIDPSDQFPCAITIPFTMQTGMDGVNIFKGITEFHVTPNKDMAHVPSMMRWYKLITDAALAGGISLGGKVEYFIISPDENAIQGPVEMQYGNESPHWGFAVQWIVKERVSVTVSA